MIGSISVVVKDKRNNYSFTLHRNITILTGESGRGKTTLYDMVHDYNQYDSSASVKVVCDKLVVAVSGKNWRSEIENLSDSVIIIDEDNQFIRSEEFAHVVKNSSNYFLLITRSYLEQLPFSVKEIYEITGSKNKKFKPLYTDTDYMYHDVSKKVLPFKPDVVITEDSKTGYQFFSTLANKGDIQCVSAEGKSNIAAMLEMYKDKKLLIIADGAAFGAEISDIVKRQQLFPKMLALFLPESFEWLILKSGLVNDPKWEQITVPEKYVDSKMYFSWERYFTELLVETTKDMDYKKYPKSKSRLPKFYVHDKSLDAMKRNMQGIDWN